MESEERRADGGDAGRTRMVLGLGSNLGDREGNIAAAIEALAEDLALGVRAASPLYETPPAGGPPQGDYLNGAVLLVSACSARDVLERCLKVERSLGRIRPDPVRWGPRTIDVDLLWIEGKTADEADLTVPHPRLAERPFALRPLLDLAPDAVDPRTGEPYAGLPAARAPLRKYGDPVRFRAR
jgi:2-amino-4-hydroxy-6-hydroxymethyldihydropteridine diphosphokinase